MKHLLLAILIVGSTTVAASDTAPTPAHQANVERLAAEVDWLILEKVNELDQFPRPNVDDYTFARRVHVDLIGRIPTLGELRTFIDDPAADKRAKLVRQLLSSKGYNSHFYNYWADLLRVRSVGDMLHHPGNLAQAIKSAIRENKPYDEFVRAIVDARGNLYDKGNGFAGYKARETMHLDRVANSVKSFLGLGLDCAQCHDHPFDDWTQKEFYRLAAFTSQVHYRSDPPRELEKKRYAKIRKDLKNDDFDKWIVYRESLRMKYATIAGTGTGYLRLPHDYKYEDGKPHDVMPARTLYGETPKVAYKVPLKAVATNKNTKFVGPQVDAQTQYANWLTSPDNDMFNKTTVNRLWHRVMGTELVGPLGGLSLDSDGPHPALTHKLIALLQHLDYDVKAFYEVLLNTKAYQSRALPLRHDAPDYLFDGPVVRRMAAEVVWDSMVTLRTGHPDKFIPTKFHYDGFTHFNEKSQKWTAEDFAAYARSCGHGRGQFYNAMHKEAAARNPDVGKPHERRASESEFIAEGPNPEYREVGELFGASTRELIDGAGTDPSIPQILYMMNGKPEHTIIAGTSELHRQVRDAKPADKHNLLWLAILGRPMSEAETAIAKRAGTDPQGLHDLAWALLNSNEFRFVR